MATPPLKTEISDTYPNPTNAVARVGFGKLYDYVTGLLGATGNAPEARAAIGAVNIAGDTLTGLLKFKTGTAIASAATINLSTATGNTVHITGTIAISAVTMSNGQVMDVIFDGILTLTHNSTTNKLPSGADITTAAGDTARYFNDGTVVYCLNYSRASGAALVAPTNVSASTQAEMETATSLTTFVSPGRQQYHPGAAKAWCYHSGSTPTISASYNLSSITKLASGDYQYNWTVGFSSINYVVSGVGSDAGGTGIAVGHQYSNNAAGTAALRWRNVANGLIDPAFGNVIVFGDLT